MSGFSEILIIIAVLLAIIVLPKRMSKNNKSAAVKKKRRIWLSGWNRMAILISLLWLSFFSLYFKPWNHQLLMFIYIGIAPVAVYWGIYWTYLGFKKRGK